MIMIENIEILLSYENLNTYEIFDKLKKSDLYNDLNFIDYVLLNYKKKEGNFVLNNQITKCIDTSKLFDMQDKCNLKGFLSMLGKSDLNGQILNCRTYKDLFKRKLESMEKNENNKCKSTYTLISGIGIFFVIVII